MIYIAHRGLTCGPDVNLENRPQQIELTLSQGIDCEIDVWRIKDKWFLGHDRPDYEVDYKFISKGGLWLHCKNLDALLTLSECGSDYNYFWHQNDDYTITSKHFIWTFPGKDLTRNSISVQPEWNDAWWKYTKECKKYKNIAGVCTKYIDKFLDNNCDTPQVV